MAPSRQILVGMGGWDLHPFDDLFYPRSTPRGFRKLEYYSRFFDLVEVNSTFYDTAFSARRVRQWIEDVRENSNFVFTVKLFRGFTHTLDATDRDLADVHRLLGALAGKGLLGGLLIQFPASFSNTNDRRVYLIRLCTALKPHRLFVEVRHDSWDTRLVRGLFEENDITMINVDLPRIGRHISFTAHASGGVAYFRMMGRNAQAWAQPWRVEEDGVHVVSDRYNYLYTGSELSETARLILSVRPTPSTTFVVFHNDPQAYSLVNGFQLRRMLMPEKKPRIPGHLMEKYPVLRSVGVPFSPASPLFAGP